MQATEKQLNILVMIGEIKHIASVMQWSGGAEIRNQDFSLPM